MSKLKQTLEGARHFIGETGAEMRRISWPSRQELTGSTLVVILMLVILSAFVWVSDSLLAVLKYLVL